MDDVVVWVCFSSKIRVQSQAKDYRAGHYYGNAIIELAQKRDNKLPHQQEPLFVGWFSRAPLPAA